MKNNIASIIKTAAVLFTIGFVCTLILALCNSLTADKIAVLAEQKEQTAMAEALPDATSFEEVKINGESGVNAVFAGKNEKGEIAGYCVKVAPLGYGGEISMIVGIKADGTVSGVDITDMNETAGLGAKAKNAEFRDMYKGKSGEISVKKSGTPSDTEISAISGATVTSKAVTSGVNAALAAVDEIMAIG